MRDAYDFSPLDAPMSRAEARARRRRILDGRSLLSATESEHQALLMLLVLPWVAWLIVSAVLVNSLVTWVARNGPDGEWLLGLVLAPIAVALTGGLLALLTRLCLIPPRWGRWVRMDAFAEANGLTFVRVRAGVDLPREVESAGATAVAPRIFDAFEDASGLLVGNWVRPTPGARGLATWRAVVRVPEASGELPAVDAEPIDGFDVVQTIDGMRWSTRFPSVRMRRSVTVRRMFATASAVAAGTLLPPLPPASCRVSRRACRSRLPARAGARRARRGSPRAGCR